MTPNKVLVVDDELHSRSICVEFLSDAGYAVESATNGKEALGVLEKKAFDLLLSDIQMPELDGVGLLKEVKKHYPEMEVILMTAYAGLPSAIEALRSGAYDYLVKPFTRDFLLNTIHRCAEKIELQRKLKESQDKLVEQEKLAALGAVASWLSHRMRNSLSVISMCAHYLNGKKSDAGSEDFKQVITAVIEKTKTLEKMTSDFIVYSRNYDLQKCMGNANTAMEDVLNSLSVQIQIQKVRLMKQLDPKLPDFACDPHTLQEAFENVVVNALQAIGSQQGQTLTVCTEIEPNAESGRIRVTVSNSGSAIPAESLEKVFAPFFTTKENGSGLGLAIVKKVVEQHGGQVSATSRGSGGTTETLVTMVFPVSKLSND